ncbi:MAG: serine/threonine-protein kinase, partial [Chloroflexota bacterium]
MTDLVGQSIDRYHILEQLGEGGMAIVYKAYDTRLERDVALKVIRTEKLTLETMSRSLKRFEREAKSLGKLTHPNIVPVSDYGEYEGKPYLVMPYLPGGTLKQKMGKPIPWQEAVQMLLPIAEALDYAHDQNMIHRDVKPSNILLTQRGQPMLTDFGIAKILDLEETQELTGTNAAVGTPEYMAPEQATAKPVDKRADIYSLGVVFYEMATGRKPFTADTPMAVLIKQATEPLPPPRKFVPNLPEAVEKVLFKALAKDRENRYQTMEEFVAGLKGMSAEKLVSKPTPVPASAPPPREVPETPTIKDVQPVLPKRIGSPSIRKKRTGVRSKAWLWSVGIVGLLVTLFAGLLFKPL